MCINNSAHFKNVINILLGYSFCPKFWPNQKPFLLKFLILTACFLSTIIYLFYSTKLLNVMMTRVKTITTIEDLLKHDFIFHVKAALGDIVSDPKVQFFKRLT